MTRKLNADPEGEVFFSDVIDLSKIDLAEVSELPNPVLRASLQRICHELADGGDTFAGFRNSMRYEKLSDPAVIPAARPSSGADAAEGPASAADRPQVRNNGNHA